MAENGSAHIRGVPVVPVAVALLVGFSLGLAVSIAMDAHAQKTAQPMLVPVAGCADCADKAKQAAAAEPAPAPAFTVPPSPVADDA